MLPNFLIIGAPRASTSYLVNCLNEHPEILIAQNGYTHDIHFLNPDTSHVVNQNYHKGIEWYEELFSAVKNEKAIGEKTATYFTEKTTPEYIKKHLGSNVKLIVILRNPLERANSDFWYHRGQFPKNYCLIDVFRNSDNDKLQIAQAGKYFENYNNYLNYFERENFHFIVFDDLRDNPIKIFTEIFNFLNVNNYFTPSQINEKINSAYKDDGIKFKLKSLGGKIKSNYPNLFKVLNENKILQKLRDNLHKPSNKDSKYPPLNNDEIDFLQNYYYDDIKNMGKIINRDLVKLWL